MDGYYSSYASGLSTGVWVFLLILLIANIVSSWVLFTKAGLHGWAAIIPFYGSYTYAKMVFGNGWLFLVTLVPLIGWIFLLIRAYQTPAVFGKKGVGMGLLSLFFSFFVNLYLAFSDAQYTGIKAKE